MSGILERLEQKLDQLLALQVEPAHKPATTMGLMPTTVTPEPTPAVDPLAFATPTPTPAATVTNDMITTLIQPHLNNPVIKGGLQAVLQRMNIPGLPAAREDQYATLFQEFQNVISAATATLPANAGNSAMPSATATTGGMSIL